MSFKERLKIFGVGFVIGLVLLYFILSRRDLERPEMAFPETVEEIQREAVPGILEAYQERRVIMDADFKLLVAEQYRRQEDGTLLRVLLLQGKDPGQSLRVLEYSHEEAGVGLVDHVLVTSADRVLVSLAEGQSTRELAEAIRPKGYRLEKRDEAGIVVSIGAQSLPAYDEAVRFLEAQAGLVYGVSPVVYGEVTLDPLPRD